MEVHNPNSLLFFQWEDKYKTGCDDIDEQHKMLFELGNKLFVAEYEDSKALILEFYRYTRYHFETEEVLMLTNDHPHYSEHRLKHEKLIQKLNDITDQYMSCPEQFSELKILIYRWIKHHILTDDLEEHFDQFPSV